jgi:hypothetical protein
VRASLLVLLAVAALPTSAAAAPVLVLGHDGRVRAKNDPFVRGPATTPVPLQHQAHPRAASEPRQRRPTVTSELTRAASNHGRRHRPTVTSVLARLYRTHAISAGAYRSYGRSFGRALKSEKRLRGTRRTELAAVIQTMRQIAAARTLTASRLPALFQTLDRNRQWWTSGPLLASAQRVEFPGSQLVWEYYPGQGIQIQVLGTFGKADGLYTAGPSRYAQLQKLLAQMIPLAAYRAGGLTWEYYFHFDGGQPPWTSAMSQGTGLEALARAYKATGNRYYLDTASQALPVFTAAPPSGVSVKTPLGNRYVQYTFTPDTSIINAFLQTLIGLYDYATVSGNPEAMRLFNAGNSEAMAEVPHFDTGAWSLYQPGVEDDLSYHELVTGFLAQLCSMTSISVYCRTARRFRTYLKTPPTLQQLTFSAKVRDAIVLRFRLSKISHVGVVITQGTTTRFQTSATLPYGVDQFTIPAITRPGTYGVRLAATDLAGNFARITGTLQISP